MEFMKKLSLFVLVVLALFALTACGDDSKKASKDTKPKKVYKVGVDATYPPFEWQVNGEYKGIDIDLIRAIAKKEGFKIEIQSMDFKGIIPALQSKQLDISIAGMSITDERKKIIDFSDPYFDAGLSVVVKDDNSAIKSASDLSGKKIAVKKGTSGAQYAVDNFTSKGATIIQFDSSPAMFEEVKTGRADALIEDFPVISYAIADQKLPLKVVGDRLNADQYGIGVVKGTNSDLMKKINKGLAALKADGSYQDIVDKYLK
jgi:polar amino acid transport system substrate-binding protein